MNEKAIISVNVNINGKNRNLCNRRYCLQCSPWGLHNTKRIDDKSIKQSTSFKIKNNIEFESKCSKCNLVKSSNQFYTRRDNSALNAYCKECSNKQSIDRFRLFKQKCVEYKGGKCRCGYNKYIGALQFHHRDSDAKDFNLSDVKKWTFDQIVKLQLDKCDILCSNCHRQEHARMKGLFK